MNTVSRETPPVGLDELLEGLGDTFSSLGLSGLEKTSLYSGVHTAFLPYFVLFLSRLKTTRCVLVLEDFSLRQSLFEVLSTLQPGLVFHLSHGSDGGDMTGADLHVLNLFSRLSGAFLVIPPSQLDYVVSSLSGGKIKPLLLSVVRSRESLVSTLKAWQFSLVHHVNAPGSYAVRGAVVDVYGYGSDGPLRLEYRGDVLHSARTFDPLTQKMVSSVSSEDIFLYPPISVGVEEKHATYSSGFKCTYMVVESAGASQIYNLRPAFGPIKTKIDVGCVSHRSFVSDHAAFDRLKGQLFEKQISQPVLFCSKGCAPLFRQTVLLDGFVLCHLPLVGVFSSLPLGLFWLSLDSLFDLPESTLATNPYIEAVSSSDLPLSDFPWGGAVVHEDLGVGLYRGLSYVSQKGGRRECVALEFKHGDIVHVPLGRLSAITPYVGSSGGLPSLTSLRSTGWARAKQKALASAGEVVEKFVRLYGERDRAEGFSFSPDGESMSKLSESFPYAETPDQVDCLNDVNRDMESEKPMDRLICGDVGFGKTEVALRAAFKAVTCGKQVLLIAPTTILSNQLFNSFSSRLSPAGVQVRHFSRSTSSLQAKKILAALAVGAVDVVVGTHRLLAKNVSPANLGLIIIDEEHRFGAKQKEFLRAFRSSVDVLSMSATPIPRTLQFSLVGIRDISTIRTPPCGRLPVVTSTELFDPQQIKSAVEYEVGRGGQVLFVHSNISEIGKLVQFFEGLLPRLRVGFAHGSMAPDDLDEVMMKMVNGSLDLLVSTTIVEAGIDIKNVNTILINNAHRYGLAQLYQMRGRVGRSTQQAYCYLLLPRGDLTQGAHERLRTIQYNTALGAGYDIALRDLEIRGGGNLFGVEQSGHLASVGFHLFCKIVREAAQERLHVGGRQDGYSLSKISFSIESDALIPDTYVEEQDDRLYFYRMLAAAERPDEVSSLEQELRDRFGPLPGEVLVLLAAKRVRQAAASLPIDSIDVSHGGATIWLSPTDDIVGQIRNVLGGASPEEASFTVVNSSEGKTGLALVSASAVDALQTIQYTFESRPLSK